MTERFAPNRQRPMGSAGREPPGNTKTGHERRAMKDTRDKIAKYDPE